MRIEDALAQFLLAGQGTRWGSAKTSEWYRHHIQRYLRWLQEEKVQGVEWLQATTIERFLATERAQQLSIWTLRARDTALRAFFDYLISHDMLGNFTNPMLKIPRPKIPKDKRPRITQLAEVRRLLDSVTQTTWTDLRDRVILQILFFSGLRVSELVGLGLADVDIGQDLLFIRSGKGDKDRLIPCLPALRSDLLAYIYSRPPYTGPELFLSNDGAGHVRGVLTAEGVRQMIRRRCKKLKIRHLNPHAFRHGAAMTLLNEGMEMSAVSRVLGHSSVKVTEDFYAKWLVEKLQEQYNRVVKKL